MVRFHAPITKTQIEKLSKVHIAAGINFKEMQAKVSEDIFADLAFGEDLIKNNQNFCIFV